MAESGIPALRLLGEEQIRDADLRAKLEEARGKFAFDVTVRHIISLQHERDHKAAADKMRADELAGMPRDRRRRSVIREVIENEGPAPENLRFMHSVLAICGLPYRQLPAGVLEYERTQGRMGLVVTAGKLRTPDGDRIQQPVPFGPKARLVLGHLTTQAIKTKSPDIELADTLTEFLRDLGFPSTGGDNGTLRAFKVQLNALFACHMEISSWDGHKATSIDAKPFDKVEVFFSESPDQRSLWTSKISFSDRMFTGLMKHAIPMDVRALRAFQGSARKLDLLYWVGYRLHSIRTPLTVSYQALRSQFGDGFARDRAFRAQLAKDVAHLKEVFPKLPLKLTDTGLFLENADPAVLALPKLARIKKR
ncbi:replication protein RepA [Nitrobacter sp. JJSN]|uniref:replication protein RepA n=1 Tax=Nitrobacter sp. JJSN TaxID=3453033 RepID=UPI003F757A03